MRVPASHFIIIALAAALGLLGLRSCDQAQELTAGAALNRALGDSVRTSRNELGQAVASIDLLEVDRKGLLETINSKDEMIGKLQAVVANDRHITSATVFRAQASGRASGVTQIITERPAYEGVASVDTSRNDCPPLPVYRAQVSGDGITASVTAGPDTVSLDSYTVTQEFAVAFTSRSAGIFKKRVRTVDVTALSPGGKVTDVRSFDVPPDKPRRGLWAALGAGLAVLGKVAVGALLL